MPVGRGGDSRSTERSLGVDGDADPAPEVPIREDRRLTVPSLRGRHVFLRPLNTDDYQSLRLAELSGERAVRWRYRGATVSPEQWARGLWDGILAQYLVCTRSAGRPLGLVLVYRPNFTDGHAMFAAEAFSSPEPSPLLMFGAALLLDYTFACWNFRKLYLEVSEYNLGQLASGVGRVFAEEGRLREHLWCAGRYWDQVTLALYRDVWARESQRVLGLARSPAVARVRLPASWDQGSG